MVETGMPKADPTRYNAFGLFINREKGDASINQVAARAGLSAATLGRWMRADPLALPGPAQLQAIAEALNRPAGRVQSAALEAAGHPSSSGRLGNSQQLIVDALERLDEPWQEMLADMVLRASEEISRRVDSWCPPM